MIADLYKALTPAGVTPYLGPEHLQRNDLRPPVALWVPVRSVFETAKSPARSTGLEPRPLFAERLTVRVRLWASWTEALPAGVDQSEADYRALRELTRTFLQELHEKAEGSVSFGDATWLTEEGTSLVEEGKALDLDVELLVPVIESAPVTSVEVLTAESEAEPDE